MAGASLCANAMRFSAISEATLRRLRSLIGDVRSDATRPRALHSEVTYPSAAIRPNLPPLHQRGQGGYRKPVSVEAEH